MALRIPPEFERAILERVQSGMYGSTDEALAACLRALERAEQELEELRQALRVADEQFERGEVVDGEEAFARLRGTGLQEYVQLKVDSGEYGSAEEVAAAGLRLLQEEDELLRRELRKGREQLARGESIPGDVAFARLKESRKATNR